MDRTQSRLTSQGQVSVPTAVRKFLHLIPGSVLVWTLDGNRIVVERATRHSTADVHSVLFPDGDRRTEPPKTLTELKQGVRQRVRSRHAGG